MSQQYTTAERLLARVGALSVELRVEHSPEALEEVIEIASSEVEWYCWQYSPAALALSRWVTVKATDLACYYLCSLQFNPVQGSVGEIYEHTIEQLKAVQAGSVVIPNIPLGRNIRPSVGNYTVDLNRYPHIRAERPRSTGPDPIGYTRRTDPMADAINNSRG